jgi:hypothetical protein
MSPELDAGSQMTSPFSSPGELPVVRPSANRRTVTFSASNDHAAPPEERSVTPPLADSPSLDTPPLSAPISRGSRGIVVEYEDDTTPRAFHGLAAMPSSVEDGLESTASLPTSPAVLQLPEEEEDETALYDHSSASPERSILGPMPSIVEEGMRSTDPEPSSPSVLVTDEALPAVAELEEERVDSASDSGEEDVADQAATDEGASEPGHFPSTPAPQDGDAELQAYLHGMGRTIEYCVSWRNVWTSAAFTAVGHFLLVVWLLRPDSVLRPTVYAWAVSVFVLARVTLLAIVRVVDTIVRLATPRREGAPPPSFVPTLRDVSIALVTALDVTSLPWAEFPSHTVVAAAAVAVSSAVKHAFHWGWTAAQLERPDRTLRLLAALWTLTLLEPLWPALPSLATLGFTFFCTYGLWGPIVDKELAAATPALYRAWGSRASSVLRAVAQWVWSDEPFPL